MKRRTGKILGMALSQKSILIAEIGTKADAPAVQHLAEFVYPEGLSLEQPVELGQAFKQFLRGQKFSTREAIIGLPAKRLVTRRKDVPPAEPAIAASMLRLQAEGEFSSEPDALVMDFAGTTSTTATSSVLLIAATRASIDQCAAMSKAAGLKLLGVTVTAAALGRATSRVPGGDGVVVSLAQGGAELVVQHGEAATQVRHLNVGDATAAESLGLLVGEIRRTVAALPRNGSPLTLAVWNSTEGTQSAGSVLEQRLSMPVTMPDLRSIVTTDETGMNRFAPAVAVALAGLDAAALPVDFLHSRLAPPRETSSKRKLVWGIAIAATVLLAALIVLLSYDSAKAQLARDKAKLDSMSGAVEEAKTAQARLEFARKWAPGTPLAVACLRDLTKLFPEENSIWITGFSLHPNRTGELLGKASNSRQVLNLLDQMNATPVFGGTPATKTEPATPGSKWTERAR